MLYSLKEKLYFVLSNKLKAYRKYSKADYKINY